MFHLRGADELDALVCQELADAVDVLDTKVGHHPVRILGTAFHFSVQADVEAYVA